MKTVDPSSPRTHHIPRWAWAPLLVVPFALAFAAAYLHNAMTSQDFVDLKTVQGQELRQAHWEVEVKTADSVHRVVPLSEFKGAVTLLVFWASWCGPCLAEMPELQALHLAYQEQGLKIIGVNVEDDQTLEDLAPFMKEHGITYAEVQDTKQKLQQIYNVNTLPSSVLIDKQEKVRLQTFKWVPWTSSPAKKIIEDLLKE